MAGLSAISRKIFGSANDRKLKKYRSVVEKINSLEKQYINLSDEDLRFQTTKLRNLAAKGESLNSLLPDAFAVVREAAKRTIGQRHFDAQLIGGMVLHEGNIAEMKTGEGKTLASTLPVYLNALNGSGVHIVTVNDYLARRDAAWMGQIYRFLDLSVGVIIHGLGEEERRQAYACDVTYGTNNEFGFDYLRDNMVYEMGDMMQKGHNYAIVDEVDSILIDEARTPLIISGAIDDESELYIAINDLVPRLAEDDYEIDEKLRSVNLTEKGNEVMEQLLIDAGLISDGGLYDLENVSLVHHVNQGLRAHKLYNNNRDYIVKNGEVVIIDEFTGRMMEGRRYSEGLHQAIEAKEKVEIKPENKTLASITFQNYFRLYNKLAGMTGTAATEVSEFIDIYNLDVIEIPTNVPVIRQDLDDEIYRTGDEKYNAIVDLIEECHNRGQPVLVGTTSIAKSEYISDLLRKKKLRHHVLNARYHEQEAGIIAKAGEPGAITIATNMAGRGTDIQLGGNPEIRIADELGDNFADTEASQRKITAITDDINTKKQQVKDAGGLYVIGSERHESRRIDNQLRGRAGRQGDPGCSKFFLSLDDDLMRIFGSDRMNSVLQTLGLREGEAIVHGWINRALEKAQQKVEGRNFDIRKNVLKFDDVVNDQRKVIFEQRLEIIAEEDVTDVVTDMRYTVIDNLVSQYVPEKVYPEQWNLDGLDADLRSILSLEVPVYDWAHEEGVDDELMRHRITQACDEHFAKLENVIGAEVMRKVEKAVLLQTIDNLWREHLVVLDHLHGSVGLRGYAQRDPLNEYKTEAFQLFESMLDNLQIEVSKIICDVNTYSFAIPPEPKAIPIDDLQMSGAFAETETESADLPPATTDNKNQPYRNIGGKMPRNAPCPCGSGKKYKHCHGRLV